jgi:hypothetical protein
MLFSLNASEKFVLAKASDLKEERCFRERPPFVFVAGSDKSTPAETDLFGSGYVLLGMSRGAAKECSLGRQPVDLRKAMLDEPRSGERVWPWASRTFKERQEENNIGRGRSARSPSRFWRRTAFCTRLRMKPGAYSSAAPRLADVTAFRDPEG